MTRTTAGILLLLAAGAAQEKPRIQTGPAVGERIPAFTLTDQTGTVRDFASLRGPKGLVLTFSRSADW